MISKKQVFEWMRHHYLGWLWPFWFCQEGYHHGMQVLWVFRFGKIEYEVWNWGPNNDHTFFYRLQEKGATKSELYNRIKHGAELVLKTDDWSKARDYV